MLYYGTFFWHFSSSLDRQFHFVQIDLRVIWSYYWFFFVGKSRKVIELTARFNYCAKILRNPSFLYIFFPRSRTFLSFLKCSWAIVIQVFWRSFKVFLWAAFSLSHFHSRPCTWPISEDFFSHLTMIYELFKHKKGI